MGEGGEEKKEHHLQRQGWKSEPGQLSEATVLSEQRNP